MVYKAYENRIQWWRGETEGEKVKRCGKCWLRPYQCYCEKLIAQQEAIGEVIGPFANSQVEVVIFYTFVEVGRSANTAHIFQNLCPEICKTIIQCDSEAEDRLFSTIMQEKVQGIEKTCILFPSSSSISFSSWIAGVYATSQSSGHSSASDASSSATQSVPSVRLIFLDGTYSGANRLASMFSKAREHYDVSLPFVHLDLEGGLRSAMAGVMYQPAKDKICTFQAMALAIKQLAPGSQLAGMLLQFLDKWVEYLLLKAIKHGKTKTLMSNKDVDNLPTEQHKSIMEARERDFDAVDNKAKKARTLDKDEADDADDDEDDSSQ
eukprot:gene40948-49948_t